MFRILVISVPNAPLPISFYYTAQGTKEHLDKREWFKAPEPESTGVVGEPPITRPDGTYRTWNKLTLPPEPVNGETPLYFLADDSTPLRPDFIFTVQEGK